MNGSGEWTVLFEQLLTEAKGDSGTWSLATYTKGRSLLESFQETDKRSILSRIIDSALMEPRVETNYKLAQMCTLIHSFRDPVYESVFKENEEKMAAKYAELEGKSELGRLTVRLLQSIFLEIPKSGLIRTGTPVATAPALRHFTVHQSVSRTPDPNSFLQFKKR